MKSNCISMCFFLFCRKGSAPFLCISIGYSIIHGEESNLSVSIYLILNEFLTI